MNIILKFIFKSIKSNKFRTFLIILSVMLSAALFFASIAISGTITEMYMGRIRQYYGSADLLIRPGPDSPTSFFYTNKTESLKDHFEYIIGTIPAYALYKKNRNETNSVNLRGFNLDELQQMNPFIIAEEQNLYPFNGKKIIINKTSADEFNLKLGETIDLELNNVRQRFTIAAITEPTGPLQNEGRYLTGIVPMDTLASLFDQRGKVYNIYIKLKNPNEKKEITETLSALYSRYLVTEPFNKQELQQQMSQISTPFMLMTTLVLLISVFIIYSSFKVITMERLPVIGTFRSIGANRKTTDFVLLMESLTYGVIGGFFGCLLGIGILYIMASIYAVNPWEGTRMKLTINFNFLQLVMTFSIAASLSFISSLMPILRISKIPVKDVILNKIDKEVKVSPKKMYLGIFLAAFSMILPFIIPRKFGIIGNLTCMILSVVAVILLVPAITGLFVAFFEKFYAFIFGNEGVLASKNLRENKNILNNISLIAIGIAGILMINTVSFSVVGELTNFYKAAKFDVWMWYYQADNNVISRIRTINGVTDVYGVYSINNTEIEIKKAGDRISENHTAVERNKQTPPKSRIRGEKQINLIHGIDNKKILDYWRWEINDVLLAKLDTGRNVLITYILKEKFGVNVGDTLLFKFNHAARAYRIIGFFSTMRNGGNYALIAERYFKLDTLDHYLDEIYIKTDHSPDTVVDTMKKKFAKNRPWINTITIMEQNELKSNDQMFVILKGFSLLTMLIGIFGVLNNFILSFLERKRHLAIFRSVGMSKRQIIKMIFTEALTGGLISSVIGIISGYMMVMIVGFIIKGMNMDIRMHYSPKLFFYALIAGIIITLISSISPAIKSSRLNIIEAIKYE